MSKNLDKQSSCFSGQCGGRCQ